MKILIIGGPGAGKTHMATALQHKAEVPLLALDKIYWNRSFTKRIPPRQRQKMLDAFVTSNSSWIIEGSYVRDWMKPLIDLADYVVIIDTPRYVRSARLIKRFIMNKMSHQSSQTFKQSILLQRWGWNYKKLELSNLDACPDTASKVIRIATKHDQRKKCHELVGCHISLQKERR